jgi:hypothetical protein
VEVRCVAEKELFLAGGAVACVKPLMCDTLTPLLASFSSSSFTRALSLSIFCCRPFHPFSSPRAPSMSKFSPI